MRRFDEGVEIWLLLCENLPYGVAEVFLIIVFWIFGINISIEAITNISSEEAASDCRKLL